jgi:hypothetical protein
MKALKTHQKIHKALEARNSRREMFNILRVERSTPPGKSLAQVGHGFGLKGGGVDQRHNKVTARSCFEN